MEIAYRRIDADTYELPAAILAELPRATELLVGELSLALATGSRLRPACVLTTRTGEMYGGHTTEPEHRLDLPTQIENVLGQVPDDEGIVAVHVAADPAKKQKHAMPRPEQDDTLRDRLDPRAPIILWQPGDNYTVISPATHAAAYRHRSPKRFIGTADQVTEQLHNETLLDELDAEFMGAWHAVGSLLGIRNVLVGSASGRNPASNALSDTYNDLDLISVTDLPPERVEVLFETLAADYGISFTKEPLVIDLPGKGLRYASIYRGTRRDGKEVEICLSVGRDLETAMWMDTLRERNLYVEF